MKVVIIGAGNVANHLGLQLSYIKSVSIVQIMSKTVLSAKLLADKIDCCYSNNLNELKEADLYLLCVGDDKIKEIANHKKLAKRTLVHTSGSTSIEVLQSNTDNYGVIYPLQTFNKDRDINFSSIPIFIEASSKEVLKKLKFLAANISTNIYEIKSKQRLILHIAAVFANNFTNHLFHITNEILSEENIKFDVLLPLLQQTFENAKTNSPQKNQTGPAVRNDIKTIEKHISILGQSNPEYAEIYNVLTKSIQKQKT